MAQQHDIPSPVPAGDGHLTRTLDGVAAQTAHALIVVDTDRRTATRSSRTRSSYLRVVHRTAAWSAPPAGVIEAFYAGHEA
jgi:hypothetical protein